MPDENKVAESSPAAEAPAAIEVPRDPAAYAAWRQTGKTPDAGAAAAKPKSEAPAPSKKESSAARESEAENNAPASEAESQQERKPRSNADTRLAEILADLKRSGLSPSELKTFKRQAQAVEQPKPAQSQSEHTVKPTESKIDPAAPVKPKAEAYKTWEEFEAAKDKYHEDLVDYKSQKAIGDYQAQQQQAAANTSMQAKFAEAKTRYGDEAETTIVSAAKSLTGDAQIPAAVRAMFEQSPVMTDLLYAMGSNAPEFEEFLALAKSNPAAAIRKMVLTESLVSAELAKGAKAAPAGSGSGDGAKRDDTGKFSPAKKVTEAPPPPREASGRSAPPADEAEVAAKDGNFALYRAAANRRDLARLKGH
jgi:hypothetical protein